MLPVIGRVKNRLKVIYSESAVWTSWQIHKQIIIAQFMECSVRDLPSVFWKQREGHLIHLENEWEGHVFPWEANACSVQFSSGAQLSDSLWPHGLQHARLPCPSPTSRACSDWCHPTISFSVVPFSSCPQSCPASGSFPVSQFFVSVTKVLELQLQWIFTEGEGE